MTGLCDIGTRGLLSTCICSVSLVNFLMLHVIKLNLFSGIFVMRLVISILQSETFTSPSWFKVNLLERYYCVFHFCSVNDDSVIPVWKKSVDTNCIWSAVRCHSNLNAVLELPLKLNLLLQMCSLASNTPPWLLYGKKHKKVCFISSLWSTHWDSMMKTAA